KINMVPDSARFSVDLRSVPGVDHTTLLETVKRHLGPDIEIKPLIDLHGISTSPDDPWIRQALDIMAGIQGRRPEPGYVNYFTDASVLTPAMNNPPTLLLGPGEPSQAHQTNEYCLVEKIDRAVAFYLAIARDWIKP
ncbi:MAG: M20/M25/M40 family metallo-hydrolase, partial [Deltaproteobacteria bacterium]|nr:M20/M25/M40 family metallo-hydrolase [Deltaproteobacteria bacterium]